MDIPKCEKFKLLYLCTRNVNFNVNNKIYIQNYGVVIGLPLGPVLANVFMEKLETALIQITVASDFLEAVLVMIVSVV